MTERKTVRRALVSVYDKSGLVELATGLHAAGVELVSTGSTAKTIADAAGVRLLSIRSIEEGNSYSFDSGLNVMYARTEDSAAAFGTDVQAAMISVSANVTIEYVIGY